MKTRGRLLRLFRKLHITVGLSAALYFMLIAATGVAINHREGFGLQEHYLSRSLLPSSYRPQDGREVRMDIVITDLHSGLIFGKVGAPINDVVAAVWFLSILSGISMLALRRSIHRRGRKTKIRYLEPIPISRESKPSARAQGAARTAVRD
jgi:uncharacterized iron-regulated membrane protein